MASFDFIDESTISSCSILERNNDSFFNPTELGHNGFAFDGFYYNLGVRNTASVASWFSEPSSITRGVQASFPTQGIALITQASLTILTQENNELEMWMIFLIGDNYAVPGNWSGEAMGWSPISVSYENGIISVGYSPDPGSTGINPFVCKIDFTQDSSYIEIGSAYVLPGNPVKENTLLYSQSFTGTVLPGNFSSSGGKTWTSNNALISPIAPAFPNPSSTPYSVFGFVEQPFAVDQRTYIATFEILTTNTILGFGSNANGDGTNSGAEIITVDTVTNTLNIAKGWTEGSTPTFVTYTPIISPLIESVIYTLVVTVNGTILTATLGDPNFGSTTTIDIGTSIDINGAVWGQLNIYPLFSAPSGQYKIHNLSVYANVIKPQAMFLGDNIIFGTGLAIPQRWATLVGNQIQEQSFVVSGKPGGESAGVLARVSSELQYILPSNAIILVGANDANLGVSVEQYTSNLNSIISQAQGFGCSVYVGTLIPLASAQSLVTQYNAFILALTGVTIIRFDIAMSVNGDGVTPNVSLYQNDNENPNAAGAAAMAARFVMDAPANFFGTVTI